MSLGNGFCGGKRCFQRKAVIKAPRCSFVCLFRWVCWRAADDSDGGDAERGGFAGKRELWERATGAKLGECLRQRFSLVLQSRGKGEGGAEMEENECS